MIETPTINQTSKQKKFTFLILLLSIFILLFTLGKTYINVYANSFVGALFEMAWLPWLAGIFILPLFTLWHIYKTKPPLISLTSLAFVLQIISLLILIFIKSV